MAIANRNRLRTARETERQIEDEVRAAKAAAAEAWRDEDFRPAEQTPVPVDPWAEA